MIVATVLTDLVDQRRSAARKVVDEWFASVVEQVASAMVGFCDGVTK